MMEHVSEMQAKLLTLHKVSERRVRYQKSQKRRRDEYGEVRRSDGGDKRGEAVER
jgi:hypothetical protein